MAERALVPVNGETNAGPAMQDEWRRNNIGRRLNEAVERFEKRVIELLAEAGHTELRLPHFNLTRHLDVAGTRQSELARRASITKQSMGELITQVEDLGIIERVQDPSDGRARLVVFTERGLDWMRAFRSALQQAESEMERELGSKSLDTLKNGLERYVGRPTALPESE